MEPKYEQIPTRRGMVIRSLESGAAKGLWQELVTMVQHILIMRFGQDTSEQHIEAQNIPAR